MASQKRKLAIIEDLSNTFIDENAKTYATQYQESLNAIQASAISRVSKGLKVTQVTIGKPINISGVNINTRNAYVLGSVSLLVQHDRNKLIARKLAPIKQIMALYSVRNPKQFAFKIDKLVQHSLGNKVVLNPRERKALGLLNRFMTDNKKQIQELVNDNTKALKEINKNISTNESKRIIKARRRLINDRIVVKGVKRPLTNNEIATRLRSEFKDDSARLERILQTEVHRQDELVKEVSAKGLGFKFKTWNTQRDSRVRETHRVLDRKKIPINADFNVGGHRASFPSDPRLPPDESINCRCFLTFSN
jgi:hypothetical protein